MTPLTDEQLKELKYFDVAITPGPWYDAHDPKAIKSISVKQNFHIFRYPTRTENYPISHTEWESNRQFVVWIRNNLSSIRDTITARDERIAALEADNARLREALASYADEVNYSLPWLPIIDDKGKLARQALAAIEETE